MKHALISTLIISVLFLSACGASTPASTATPSSTEISSATPTQPANTIGGITNTSVQLKLSSGTECSADATYMVTLDITSNGSTTAQYVIDATDGSGQVSNGIFDSFDSPEVTDSLTFAGAETKSIQLTLKGPYSYSDSVTIRARVNGQAINPVMINCTQSGTGTAVPTSIAAVACDAAQFIADVTVPDNTVFKPGDIFTKTWRLKNIGTCTWDGNYRVVADSGPGMTQSSEYLLSAVSPKSTVAPGETVDISIDMQASSTTGTYQTFWKLQNSAGSVVPVTGGTNGALFYVQIKVKEADSNGKVTFVGIRIVQEQGSGAACTADTTYFVYLDITSTGTTTAKYRVDATDESGQVPDGVFDGFGSSEGTGSIDFNAAGTQTVTLRLTGPYSYPDKITIRVSVNGGASQSVLVPCQ